MFIVPLITAIGSAAGTLFGVGEAAAVAGGAAAAGGAASAATAATGILGTGITWSGLSTGLGLIGSGVSALASYNQGQQQAAAYRLQATNALIEGNQRSIEYQRQGLQVMGRMIETNATINARAAAGGIDPFSGSAGDLSTYAFAKGADEYSWAKQNATSAILQGESTAAAYRTAAGNAESSGTMNAVGSLLMGAARFGSIWGDGGGRGATSLLKPIGGPAVTPTAFGFARGV